MNCSNTIDLQDISEGFVVASTGLERFLLLNERDGSVVRRNVLSLRMVEDWSVKGVALVVAVANENAVVEWSLGPPQFITHSSIVSKLFSFPKKKQPNQALF